MCKFIFGITGPTGAGKSTVSAMFRELGADVFDADAISRIATAKGTPCLRELTDAFGTDILLESGELNRKKLGSIVFSDKQQLQILNAIVHRYIRDYITERVRLSPLKICAIDGAVLIGSSIENMCRFMVSVIADEDIRLNRIISRDSLKSTDAKKRMNSQPGADFYAKHSKYVIKNNGDTEELRSAVTDIFNNILKESAGI